CAGATATIVATSTAAPSHRASGMVWNTWMAIYGCGVVSTHGGERTECVATRLLPFREGLPHVSSAREPSCAGSGGNPNTASLEKLGGPLVEQSRRLR